MLFTVVWRSDYEGRQITACQAQIQFMLGEIYRWISRAGLLCLAVGGFVPLAAPPKNGPSGIRRPRAASSTRVAAVVLKPGLLW